MSEAVTAPNPTDATPSSEAAAASLLSSTGNAAETQQQGTEQAAAPVTGDKPADENQPASQEQPAGAPEKYEFSAPEGTTYDPAVLDGFSAAAKEANLSQDAAAKLLQTMAPKIAERQQASLDHAIKETRDGWAQASRDDKEFGGDKLQENLGVAKKALDQFATPELRTLLDSTGLGNNPEIIRFLYRAGKSISEDGFVAGRSAPSVASSAAEKLYGTKA